MLHPPLSKHAQCYTMADVLRYVIKDGMLWVPSELIAGGPNFNQAWGAEYKLVPTMLTWTRAFLNFARHLCIGAALGGASCWQESGLHLR